MNKEIVIIGDIEMGGGNLTDDFISDKALSSLINSLKKKKHPVDLVLNGDTFDFLKCPYIKDKKKKYPRHITEEISVNKLRLMYNAHKRVFEALKNFVKTKDHKVYFIVGNHDYDLVFKSVQNEIKKILGDSDNVIFPGLKYHGHGVYVEHGQQYDFLNQVNFKHLFMNYKGKSILNMPWINFGLISRFMGMKEDHPFLERITPHKLLFSLHSMVLRKINLRSLGYFIKSVLYYPFRYYSDPTYTVPSKLFGELYYRVKNKHWDVDEILDIFKRKRKKKTKIYVLGHIHKKEVVERKNKVVIHPGSWRDEYHLDAKTRILTPKKKYYVDIQVEGDELNYEVKEFPINRSVFLFDEVRKDELTYIYLAAREEGYELHL